MDFELTSRRALVLGASRGLGGAIARLLAVEGAEVLAASRSGQTDWAKNLAPDVQARIIPVKLDLNDAATCRATVAELLSRGAIDILVNNSGGPPPGKILDVAASVWQQHFSTMATALFDVTAQIAPGMAERGWGRILTIASSGVEQPIPNLGLSNTIRSSIIGWSKTLSNELAPRGITVNVLLPGRIHTDRVDELDQAAAVRSGQAVEDVAKASAAAIPAGRYGRPEEFAAVAAFLCSAHASYVTGSKIRVDGGSIRSI